jgi:DNA-binding GntR family transcriptional regulator
MKPPIISLHHEVADLIRDQIFDGELASGAFIDEMKLCETLSISRTPLREALKVLVAEGLLRHETRVGCFVRVLTSKDIDEIFPVLGLLEGRAAYEAALRLNDADIEALGIWQERLGQLANDKDIKAYFKTNWVIHESIIALANNAWLAQVIAELRRVLRLSRLLQLQLPDRLEKSFSEHEKIFAALKAKNPSDAQEAMKEHLNQQHQVIRHLVDTSPQLSLTLNP